MALRFEAKTIKAIDNTSTHTIDLICKLAKEQNKEGLADLISSGVCIDIHNEIETPAQRIASEKKVDVKALALLISMGAPLNTAVWGAARGGHLSLVGALLRRGASINSAAAGAALGGHLDLVRNCIRFGASINSAVVGAALGGHIVLVENLIRCGASLNEAVWSAARGGHLALVEDLISRGASLNFAVGGAARGGHLTLVENLIERGAPLDDAVKGAAIGGYFSLVEGLIHCGASLDSAVAGAALGGHFAFVEDLIRRGASLNLAAKGAARGGHLALLENLIQRGAMINMPVLAAAIGGHLNLIEYLIFLGASLNNAVKGAALGGHLALVEDLLHRGASLVHAVEGARNAGLFANKACALRLLVSIQDTTLRMHFVEEAKKSKFITFDLTALLSSANTLATLMHNWKINLEQALAWEAQDMRNTLTLCRGEKYLPQALLFIVASYLSPSFTNEKELSDLFSKAHLNLRKLDLKCDLKRFYLSSCNGRFFSPNLSLENFAVKCQKATSETELDKSIADEIRTLSKKDSYSELLHNHAPRR